MRYRFDPLLPDRAKTMARMIPITNNIHAILVATPAMPLNPKIAATNAKIRKNIAQPNIKHLQKNCTFLKQTF